VVSSSFTRVDLMMFEGLDSGRPARVGIPGGPGRRSPPARQPEMSRCSSGGRAPCEGRSVGRDRIPDEHVVDEAGDDRLGAAAVRPLENDHRSLPLLRGRGRGAENALDLLSVRPLCTNERRSREEPVKLTAGGAALSSPKSTHGASAFRRPSGVRYSGGVRFPANRKVNRLPPRAFAC